jgi:hypothetical protein
MYLSSTWQKLHLWTITQLAAAVAGRWNYPGDCRSISNAKSSTGKTPHLPYHFPATAVSKEQTAAAMPQSWDGLAADAAETAVLHELRAPGDHENPLWAAVTLRPEPGFRFLSPRRKGA